MGCSTWSHNLMVCSQSCGDKLDEEFKDIEDHLEEKDRSPLGELINTVDRKFSLLITRLRRRGLTDRQVRILNANNESNMRFSSLRMF